MSESISNLPSGDFTEKLGISTQRLEDGICEMALTVGELHQSRANRAHGGVLFTMLDTAMGRAVISRLPAGRGCATIEAKINYFRPVQSGRIIARGEALRLTRRTAYAEGVLIDEAGNELARSSGTFFLTENITQSERERI